MQASNKSTTNQPEIPSLITGTLLIMENLTQILVQEADLVKMRKMAEHAELLKQKQRLTMDYRANMKSIAAQPDILKHLPEDMRASIREASQKLADVTDSNAKLLRNGITAAQRLIQNIVSIVKKEKLTNPAYNNPNTAHMALGTYSPTCRPVTLSRMV